MRLIDADALKNAFEEDGHLSGYIEEFIDDMPTLDIVPVVHGKWVFADDEYLRCSECTQKAPVVQPYDDEPTTTATNYCPYCGAIMNLEV